VGQSDEADVGDDFEFKHNPARFAGFARFTLARRPIRCGSEVFVAASAFPTAGRDDVVADFSQVFDHVATITVGDNGARRHEHDEVVATETGFLGTVPWLAAGGTVKLAISEMGQIVDRRIGTQDDTAAVAAVATVRPAARDVLFTPEADAPAPPVTALDKDGESIDKHENYRV
jgi:hypothetical protein